jgi:hypothetical protein
MRGRIALAAVALTAALLPGTPARAAAPEVHTLLSSPGQGFATVALTGAPGQTVRLRADGRTSAPIHLDGVRQVAGISTSGATPLELLDADAATAGTAAVTTTAAGPTTSTVTSGTRVVNVNGQAFTAKGFLYWPAKVGEEWPANTWADGATCQNDARLMGAAGVTLLRVPFEDHEPAVHDAYIQCLDAFYANGISVLWLFGPPGQLEHIEDNDAFVQAYADKLATAVADVGDHPATAFWTVGNEIERSNSGVLWLGDKNTNHPAMLEHLIQGLKTADGNRHIVGSTICCPIPFWLANANVPSLDFWGLNAYGQPYGDHVNFFNTINAADPRPKIITETGIDRYHCIPGLVQSNGIIATCKTSYKNQPSHSGENQTEQRDWDVTVWDHIATSLSTPSNPGGALFGATFFMWSDLWWFSLGLLLPSSTVVHETIGASPWPAPDNIINIEWHGVSNAQAPGLTEPRVTAIALDGLARRWAATAPPTLSNVRATTDGVTITVTWTTSEPATSEIQAGVNGEENRDGGDMRSDETLFRRVAYDAVLTTSHSVAFLAPTADPGVCEKVAVRSFTADGRHAAYPTLIVGCPSTGRPGGV